MKTESKTSQAELKPMMMLNDHIQLIQRHLSTDETRYAITFFLVKGNIIYATDGRRAVRVIHEYKLSDGTYRFYTKPKLSKSGVSEVVLINGIELEHPDYSTIWIDDPVIVGKVRIIKDSKFFSSAILKIYQWTDRAIDVDYIKDLVLETEDSWQVCVSKEYTRTPLKSILMRLNKSIEVVVMPFDMEWE